MLFESGSSFFEFPLKVFYQFGESDEHVLQTAFSVSTKRFGKAVHRNRIKRLMRETWRLNNESLKNVLISKGRLMNVFLIYTGNELPEYQWLSERMIKIIEGLEKKAIRPEANRLPGSKTNL